ncbi:UNVERIFIED_CONTAM: hypothetical protein NCL1_57137 [Trichonephila clavipes]
MIRREPEEEKGQQGHRVTCVISEKMLDNCPRLRLSECLNQMHKEEKSLMKEKKRNLAALPVEKVTKPPRKIE